MYIHTHIYIYMRLCICVFKCVCVCVCILRRSVCITESCQTLVHVTILYDLP